MSQWIVNESFGNFVCEFKNTSMIRKNFTCIFFLRIFPKFFVGAPNL